jgi:hypothetical protein
MAAVDGDRDGLRRGRWCRGLARHHLLLQTSTHPYGSQAGRLHRRDAIERQKFRQQCPGPAVRKQRPHLGDDALVFRRASIGHNLGDGIERMPPGYRAPAGQKAWRPNLYRPKQRGPPPRADILERPLRPTMRADPPLPAVFLRLRLNKVLLQFRQCPFSVRQRQPDPCSRAFGRVAATRADFVRAHGALARGQLHHDAPLHPIPPTGRFRAGLYHSQV